MLDRRGIGPNTAFTSYTYEEYAALPEAPKPDSLMARIIDSTPFTELYALPITAAEAQADAADKKGDMTSFKVEVIGGGTIDGETSKVISGMNYQSFSDFRFLVNGATSATQLRFTSETAEGGFTRWFLDDICVVKH